MHGKVGLQMIDVIGIALLVLGIIIFGVGYKRNRRNQMLLGTVMIFLGASLSDMIQGAVAGWRSANAPK